MAYNVQSSILSGGAIPNIYITGINLSTGTSTSTSRIENPHIRSGSARNRAASVSPASQENNKSGSLKVELNMHFKKTDINSLMNSSLVKNLKVLMIQCTSEEMHESLTSNFSNFMSNYINTEEKRDKEGKIVSYRIVSLASYRDRFSSKSKTSCTDGVTLKNYSLDQSFILDTYQNTPSVKFLSYFVVAFIDHNEIINDFNGRSNQGKNDERILSSCSFGDVSSEIVISKGKTKKDSFSFKSKSDNKFWTASKHQMENNSYMKYSIHSGGPNEELIMVKTDNVKLKDHRVFDQILSLNINLTQKKNTILKNENLISELRKDRSLSFFSKENKDFISELMITRDTSNSARFMFSINVEEMINSGTDFPMFLSNLKSTNPTLYHRLMASTRIKNFKMSRRTLKFNKDSDISIKKSNFIEDEESTIIFETCDSSKSAPYLKPNTYTTEKMYNGASELLGVKPRVLGSIEELSISSNSLNIPLRHFSGSDFDISQKPAGVYEYVLEIDFEDPVLPMLKQMRQQLAQIVEGTTAFPGLEQYHRDSMETPGAFDPVINQFSESFKLFYDKKYSRVGSYGGDESKSFVLDAVSTFVSIMYSLVGSSSLATPALTQKDVLMYLVNISSPTCGNPEGIGKFIELVNIFGQKIQNLIDKNSRYKKYRGEGSDQTLATNRGVETSSETMNKKVSHVFKEVYNAETSSKIGYEYLFRSAKEKEKNFNGLTLINTSHLNGRFNLETEKYFKSPKADVSIVDKNNNQYNAGENIENAKYAYLSVSSVHLLQDDKNIIYSNINRTIKSPQFNKMNEVLSQILMYNYSKNTKINISAQSDTDNTAHKLAQTLNQASIGNSRMLRRGISTDKTKVFDKKAKTDLIDDGELLYVDKKREDAEASNMEKKYKRLLALNNIISNSDFLSKSNSSKYYFLNDDKSADRIKHAANRSPNGISGAPNQIKSLFLSILKSNNVYDNGIFKDIGNSYNVDRDIFRDPSFAGFIFFNYKNLRRIEVFRGYQALNGQINIKKPIFTAMQKNDMLGNQNSPLLCRHVKYESDLFGIKQNKNTELPTYNEFFLVSDVGPEMINSATSPANSFVLSTFYKQYNAAAFPDAINFQTASRKFFRRRAKTTEMQGDEHHNIPRMEYMNSNIVLRNTSIYSQNLVSRSEHITRAKNIQNLKNMSIFEMYNRVKNSNLSMILEDSGIVIPNNMQTNATPFSTSPDQSGGSGEVTSGTGDMGSGGGSTSSGTSGGSTY